MSVLIKGLEMPETEYMDVRIFRDGTAAIATGTKPYYRELKAEPVRHGMWTFIRLTDKDYGHKAKECSSCGSAFFDTKQWNYCPNCGARMEEE